MENFKFYEVGGKIRDELLGLTSKDVDYVAVPRGCMLDAGCSNANKTFTREEIEKDKSRWNGYEVGDYTNAFHSPEDIIALAKEICKVRFLGNWKLKIVYLNGEGLDFEILVSEL